MGRKSPGNRPASNNNARSRRTGSRAIVWLLPLGVAAVLAAGCAASGPYAGTPVNGDDDEQGGELRRVRDENFKLTNPSRDAASATGIGCGGTKAEALGEARRTAQFNLRGVTGNANYRIRYSVLRELPRPDTICLEVEARALGSS